MGENRHYIEVISSNRFYTAKRHYSHYHARYRSVNRSRNLNNLIPVQQTPIQFANKPGLRLLQLAVLNFRSIRNKTLQIKDYIVDNDIDIMALTETWLKDHDNCEFVMCDICPSGYVFSYVPRETGSGGGVGIVFKHSLKVKKLKTKPSFKSFELMQLLLHNNSVTTRIVIIYRPLPSSANGFTVDLFLDEFATLLELLASSSGKLLIMGDLNIHVNDATDTTALKFLDLLDLFNLMQHISMPTHKNSNTLDLIITRLDEQIAIYLSMILLSLITLFCIVT